LNTHLKKGKANGKLETLKTGGGMRKRPIVPGSHPKPHTNKRKGQEKKTRKKTSRKTKKKKNFLKEPPKKRITSLSAHLDRQTI